MSSKSRGAVYKGEKLEDSFRFIILEVIGEEATEGPFNCSKLDIAVSLYHL